MTFPSSRQSLQGTGVVGPTFPALAGFVAKHNLVWAAVGLFLVSLVIMARQLTSPDFASCVIDDSILQMSWVRQFTQAVREGTWLPRWLPDANGGHGSPVFVFYSPLVYYVTAGLQLAGGSVIWSMKIVRFLGLWLSGLAMFWFVRGRAGGRLPWLVSLAYVALPFHVLDVSYWTLYAEPWAWIWFPLILRSLDKMIGQGNGRRVLSPTLVCCYAGLILTHLVSGYMFSFVMVGFVWFCSERVQRIRNCLNLLVNAGMSLALAAFFLLPAWYERRFVHIEYSTLLPEFNYRNTFLFLPNPELIASNPFQARTIFLLQCVTIAQCAGLVASTALLWRWQRDVGLSRILTFAFGVVLLCLFLMSRASSWVWEWTPGLSQIQFSTRWLSVLTLMAALPLGCGLASLRDGAVPGRTGMKLSLVVIAVANILGSILIVRGSCFLGPEEVRKAELNLYNAPEYNPNMMVNWRQRVIEPEQEKWWIRSGSGRIEVRRWAAHERRLAVDASSIVELKLRHYDYPGWTVKIDGLPSNASTDPADGRTVVRIPPGLHVLELSFVNTAWRTLATGVSVAALILLLFLTLKRSLIRTPAVSM